MNKTRRYERLGLRYQTYALLCLLLIVGIVGALLIAPRFIRPSYSHVSVVFVSDPMVVATWDRDTDWLVLTKIPSDSSIDAAFGYGRYPLSSLWKLGTIEKRGGEVLAESLEDTLGIPVQWYLGTNDGFLEPVGDEVRMVQKALSLQNIPRVAAGFYTTNMPTVDYLRLAWFAQSVPSDRIRSVDLSVSSLYETVQLPDGSTTSVIDKERLDTIFGNTFEDARIRKEAVRVGVRNTTETTSLGQRVARLLSRIGVLVVSVENERPQVDRCVLRGAREVLGGHTASVIANLYDCSTVVSEEEDRSDLTILIGSAYQARFVPLTR